MPKERLFLGVSKSLDWEMVKRREDQILSKTISKVRARIKRKENI
jgi:hypothetical protein